MITSTFGLSQTRPTSNQANFETPKVPLGYIRHQAKSRRFYANSELTRTRDYSVSMRDQGARSIGDRMRKPWSMAQSW